MWFEWRDALWRKDTRGGNGPGMAGSEGARLRKGSESGLQWEWGEKPAFEFLLGAGDTKMIELWSFCKDIMVCVRERWT